MTVFLQLIFLVVVALCPNQVFSQAEGAGAGIPPAADAAASSGENHAAAPAQAAAPSADMNGASVMEIKRLEADEQKYSFELRDTDLGDLFRVLAHDYKLNLLVDKEVSGRITASFSNISLEEALSEIAESQGLLIEKKNNVTRIGLNLVTRVFMLKYVEASQLLQATTGTDSTAAAGAGGGAAGAGGGQPTQASTIFSLLSSKGKVLLGNLPNSLLVIDYPRNIAGVEAFLQAVDKKMTKRVFKLRYLKASELLGIFSSSPTANPAAASPAVPASGSGNPADAAPPA